MVDGLERSDAQRIAALEARVAELERGNPTCVCGAYTPKPKREEFPLPWRKEHRFEQMWVIRDANGLTICANMTEDCANAILSLASRLEAAEKVVNEVRLLRIWLKCKGICPSLIDALSAYDKSTLAPVDG